MRCSGLAQSHGTVPPISQRPLRRSTTYQGQERSRCPGRPGHRVARGLPVPGRPRLSSLPTSPGFPWGRVTPSISCAVAPGVPLANDRVAPKPKGSKSSLRRVAQSFLRRRQLGVSPPPYALKFSLNRGSELSSPHITRGFPSATRFEVFPEPGGSGCTLAGFPLTGWHRAFPEPEGPKVCPIPGGPGFPPHRWLRVSSSPIAPGDFLPQGPKLPFAGWLGVSPSPVTVPGGREFLRLSRRPHKRFRAAISRFFLRPQAIHS
jgi:hypothetical protein